MGVDIDPPRRNVRGIWRFPCLSLYWKGFLSVLPHPCAYGRMKGSEVLLVVEDHEVRDYISLYQSIRDEAGCIQGCCLMSLRICSLSLGKVIVTGEASDDLKKANIICISRTATKRSLGNDRPASPQDWFSYGAYPP